MGCECDVGGRNPPGNQGKTCGAGKALLATEMGKCRTELICHGEVHKCQWAFVELDFVRQWGVLLFAGCRENVFGYRICANNSENGVLSQALHLCGNFSVMKNKKMKALAISA